MELVGSDGKLVKWTATRYQIMVYEKDNEEIDLREF